MQRSLILILKGFFVGGSMLVPGVSGGAMAIILGVYDDLIHAVACFRKDPRRHGKLLLLFGLAGLCGMLLVARPLLALIEQFPQPALYFFLGAVAGSIPMMLKLAQPRRSSWSWLIWPLLGMAVVFAIPLLGNPESGFNPDAKPNVLLLLVSGLFGAVALVLPGISMSYVWLLFGMYDSTMRALSILQLNYLLPLGLGLALGTILCARFLERAMQRYPTPTYLLILGFLIGSIVQVFPGLPTTGAGWLACPLLFLCGLAIVHLISKPGR